MLFPQSYCGQLERQLGCRILIPIRVLPDGNRHVTTLHRHRNVLPMHHRRERQMHQLEEERLLMTKEPEKGDQPRHRELSETSLRPLDLRMLGRALPRPLLTAAPVHRKTWRWKKREFREIQNRGGNAFDTTMTLLGERSVRITQTQWNATT